MSGSGSAEAPGGDRPVGSFQIAQLNVARAVAPLESAQLADFMARLDEVNALAERSPGFVWRLKDESGNATDINVGDDPLVIVNLTLWASPDDLFDFTYRSDHKTAFARRFEWFERSSGPNIVMWWQPAGTIPTIEDGFRRLRFLTEEGPTPEAFTFKHRFPLPG